ncbi:MAG: hypothetical protein HC836_31810 [Richelia sp. RM2_1_2]|nr:hypothetical protein [Richelia sp. RM2_1_2]
MGVDARVDQELDQNFNGITVVLKKELVPSSFIIDLRDKLKQRYLSKILMAAILVFDTEKEANDFMFRIKATLDKSNDSVHDIEYQVVVEGISKKYSQNPFSRTPEEIVERKKFLKNAINIHEDRKQKGTISARDLVRLSHCYQELAEGLNVQLVQENFNIPDLDEIIRTEFGSNIINNVRVKEDKYWVVRIAIDQEIDCDFDGYSITLFKRNMLAKDVILLKDKYNTVFNDNAVSIAYLLFITEKEANNCMFRIKLTLDNSTDSQNKIKYQVIVEGKEKKQKPSYVRTGAAPAKQSGAGAHDAGNKKGKLAKLDPVKGKHKKGLDTISESKSISWVVEKKKELNNYIKLYNQMTTLNESQRFKLKAAKSTLETINNYMLINEGLELPDVDAWLESNYYNNLVENFDIIDDNYWVAEVIVDQEFDTTFNGVMISINIALRNRLYIERLARNEQFFNRHITVAHLVFDEKDDAVDFRTHFKLTFDNSRDSELNIEYRVLFEVKKLGDIFKKKLTNHEENKMSDKNKKIEEGVMGMASVPGLSRLRELAGLPPALTTVSDEPTDTSLDEPVDDFDNDIGDVPLDAPFDEPVSDVAGPIIGDEVPDGAVDFAPSSENPDVSPALPPMPSSDVRSEIESAISTMLSKAPELKIADYKSVLSQAEDAVAQMRAMGSQYLKEGKATETLREWVEKQTGFKKTLYSGTISKNKSKK